MLSTIALIVRRPDVSRREFRDHYEEIHAPLAIPFMSGITRYVRNHLQECLVGGEPGFDVFSEFTYRSPEDAIAMTKFLETEEAVPLKQDELSFMDVENNRFFAVGEAEVLLDGAPAPGGAKLAVAARLDDPARFAPGLLEPLLAALGNASRCVAHEALGGPHGKPYDVVGFVWLAGEPDAAALASWKPRCDEARVIRVEECVSALG